MVTKGIDWTYIKTKFLSRKFLLGVTALLCSVFSAELGMTDAAAELAVRSATVFIFGEAAVDLVRALMPFLLELLKKKKKETAVV